MKEKEKIYQLVEAFLHAEELVRKEEEIHQGLTRFNKQEPKSHMAHESMIKAMNLLDTAFEELLKRTDLGTKKIRYSA